LSSYFDLYSSNSDGGNLPVGSSTLFEPQRLLLRGLFFINSDRTKYVSVGIYPGRDYDVLLEFGGCKQTPIFLRATYSNHCHPSSHHVC
jgi:hypothetical protein